MSCALILKYLFMNYQLENPLETTPITETQVEVEDI